MAWNEPGGGKRDPWSGGDGNQGPPDLDEVVRKLQDKLGGLFGGRRSPRGGNGGGGGGGGGPTAGGLGARGIGIAAGIAFVVWLASGIYIIEPAERGVELRFGAYSDITQPGPHWHFPYPIGTGLGPHPRELGKRIRRCEGCGLCLGFFEPEAR
jgi:membrane protease subunit HflK